MIKINNKIIQNMGDYIDNSSHTFIFKIINANFTSKNILFYIISNGKEYKLIHSQNGNDVDLVWNVPEDIDEYKIINIKIIGKVNNDIVWQTNNSIDIPIIRNDIQVSYKPDDFAENIKSINEKISKITMCDYVSHEELKDLVSLDTLKNYVNNIDLSQYIDRKEVKKILEESNLVKSEDISNFASVKFVFDLIEKIQIPPPTDLSELEDGIYILENEIKTIREEMSLLNNRYRFNWELEEYCGLKDIFVTVSNDKIKPYNYSSKDYLLGCVSESSKNPEVITSGRIIVKDDGTCIVGKFAHPNTDGICSIHSNGFIVLNRIDDTHIEIFL